MNSDSEKTLDMFRRTGAYLQGHFRLTSGLHSPEYLQCALVLQHPDFAEQLGSMLAIHLQKAAKDAAFNLVVAPAMGGMIIGHEVARALKTRFVFTERDPASRTMLLRRGFQVTAGENIAVVEDVVTTGGSSKEVIEIIRAAGANVVIAGSIIDRSGGKADLGVERAALATLNVVSYTEENCPMCRQGIPLYKPGSRPS